jgi:nitrate reductase gamma subunit
MNALNYFFFQLFPYLALAVFAIGCWARFDHGAYTWRTGSSQLLSSKWMRLGSNWFHIGVIAILCGHFVGLLTPEWAYKPFMSSGTKQLLAIVVGGFFGLMCFIGMTILLLRRLFNARVRAAGTGRDLAILLLLYAQLLLGMASIFVSVGHLDGSVMVQLGHWAQHIVTFRGGASEFVANVHWIYKAHITLGLFLVMVTPFTRLVHVWSVPVGYLTRPYQVVRRRVRPLDYTGR